MTQDIALAILKSGASVFLTGQPGAGKTHVVNAFVKHLRAHGIEPALTASTGIAATHIGGMTIHSWSGIGIKDFLTRWDIDRIAQNEKVSRRVQKARTLIIDEISMLDARILNSVDQVCKAIRQNTAPFGGLQVVLVGDFFQLPPVSRDGRQPEFAFQSQAWEALRPSVCYLSEQYRQDDGDFLNVLAAVRTGSVAEEHVEILQSRAARRDDAPHGTVKLYSHNADVDRINEMELGKLVKPGATPREFAMRSVGASHLQETLKRSCLSPEKLRLVEGASVMFTRNDQAGAFVNGTLGKVVGFDRETGTPRVETREGAEITAHPMEWKIDDQGKVLAALEQVPLRLAWAMTVHKSQGMSLDAAVMDLGGAFEYGQGYVALSRVRRLSGLYLLGLNRRALEVHPTVLQQDQRFLQDSNIAEEAMGAMTLDEMDEAAKRFIVECGGKFPSAKGKSVQTRDDDGEVRVVREDDEELNHVEKARLTRPKAYARWSAEEEQQLRQMFADGVPIKDIAEKLERKRGGIKARLVKIGLLEE